MTSFEGDVYLRSDTKLEPLVCSWYAWTHLISPLQHAMNVTYRHIPLLRSFIGNPQAHLAASRDPTMFGGPFVDLPERCVDQVRHLLDDTQERCAHSITLASQLRKLDEHLQSTAQGYSLSEFYQRPPDALSGLVEFLYDLNNHPRLRVHEELLYDEQLDAGLCEILLSSTPDSQRPFFMSTPRLTPEGGMKFRLAFADSRLDELAAMRTQSRPFAHIARLFDVSAEHRAAFRKFFTSVPPCRRSAEYAGSGLRIRYFGHACVLIQTSAVSVLIDPMLAWDRDPDDNRFTFTDLPEHIDYVVLSHNHQDHCVPEVLIQLRHRIGRVVVPANNSGNPADPSMRLLLRRLGFRDVQVIGAFDEVPLPDGRIVSLPFSGEHVDLDIHARQGVLLEVRGRRLAFLVDSDGSDAALFGRMIRRIGSHLDVLFIGMECHGAPLTWLYGPLMTRAIKRRDDDSRRLSSLDSTRARQVLEHFSVDRAFVYAMGQEPWLRYIMGLQYTPNSIQLREVASFLEHCRRSSVEARSLFIRDELELASVADGATGTAHQFRPAICQAEISK